MSLLLWLIKTGFFVINTENSSATQRYTERTWADENCELKVSEANCELKVSGANCELKVSGANC
jgi:hypothetical protein